MFNIVAASLGVNRLDSLRLAIVRNMWGHPISYKLQVAHNGMDITLAEWDR
jgi:hypothetical protein